jgi:hypothetical protein
MSRFFAMRGRVQGLRVGSARLLIVIITVLVGALAVAPFYYSRYEKLPGSDFVLRLIDSHDLWMHLHIMEQFDKVLRSGEIYPRWMPDINHGYGILNLIFYPPGFFYLTSAAFAAVGDWIGALFLVSALTLAGSGITLYMLARTFYSKAASAVAAILYMLIPFHMLDLYWRGALPQFVSYCLLPLVIYFAYRVGREGRARHFAGLAFCYGLFLLTHMPVGLMLTYALGIYGLIWSYRERDLRVGIRLALGMGLGLALSAIYWLPAAVETKYAYEYASEIYPYHQSYITLIPVKFGIPYESFWTLLNLVFIAHAVALLTPLLILKKLLARTRRATGAKTWSPTEMWITMGAVTLFLSTSFSIFLSKLMVKIDIAVPAWRWMAVASVFTALVAAACYDRLRQAAESSLKRLWVCRALYAAGIAFTLWVSIYSVIIGALSNPTFQPKAESAYHVIESSWTPKEATRPHELPDTPLAVLEPEGDAEVVRWDPQRREVHVSVSEPATLRLKSYNFPGWSATIDGQPAAVFSDKDGAVAVSVPPGIHTVKVSFVNSPPRTIGKALSILALAAVFGLAALPYLPVRRRAGAADDRASEREQPQVEEVARLPRQQDVSRAWVLRSIKEFALVGLTVIVMVSGLIVFANQKRVREERATPVGGGLLQAQNDPAASETKLFISGASSIRVAADDLALTDLINALAARDENSMESLEGAGRVFSVSNDTRVRVLERTSTKAKVRVLEGENTMKEGWVVDRWLR